MTHNIAVGTAVSGLMTVNGVAGQTVHGIVLGNDVASETYFVGVRFKRISYDHFRPSIVVSIANPSSESVLV